MPHHPDSFLDLPVLHNTFVLILKGEGGNCSTQGRRLRVLGGAMTVHPKPEAVEALLGWMFGSHEPLNGSPMSSGCVIPRILGTVGPMLGGCGADPFPAHQR